MAGTGDVTVWINSPGGDCIAAAQIYTMLKEYPGKVTVKIDGMAASAASVVAMAGDSVLMSPVCLLYTSFNTCLEGYHRFGFDDHILKQAVADSTDAWQADKFMKEADRYDAIYNH